MSDEPPTVEWVDEPNGPTVAAVDMPRASVADRVGDIAAVVVGTVLAGCLIALMVAATIWVIVFMFRVIA